MSVQEGGESDDTTSASALSVGGQYGPDSLDNAVSPWKGRTGARTRFYSRSLDLRHLNIHVRDHTSCGGNFSFAS